MESRHLSLYHHYPHLKHHYYYHHHHHDHHHHYHHHDYRLQWTYALGSATVKGFFGPKGKKDIDLQVVTLQAIVLLAFNKDAGMI